MPDERTSNAAIIRSESMAMLRNAAGVTMLVYYMPRYCKTLFVISALLAALVAPAVEAQAPAVRSATVPGILCSLDRTLGPLPGLIVDLRLRSGSENRTPGTADSAAVLRVGGRILHAFSVAMLRVAVDTTALRSLLSARSGIADVAYRVVDTTRSDVRLQVFFTRPVQATDTTVLAALGGSSFFGIWGAPLRVLSLTAPDSAVARIAAAPAVARVQAQAMVCLTVN